MRESFEIKLPASIAVTTAPLRNPSPRRSAARARDLKPTAQPYLTRRPSAPRRAAY
ncbi:hypothetical protein [Nonomuraea sp. SYSU D8015]|uniref:hypothetical protein n=1 Tax=Nonomuraea sp. SYSU D8015 TaxID=2593644 RepID=UPI00166093E3|nr:hypothetical protein [Nonomuraea sp. SYSU D8015]